MRNKPARAVNYGVWWIKNAKTIWKVEAGKSDGGVEDKRKRPPPTSTSTNKIPQNTAFTQTK